MLFKYTGHVGVVGNLLLITVLTPQCHLHHLQRHYSTYPNATSMHYSCISSYSRAKVSLVVDTSGKFVVPYFMCIKCLTLHFLFGAWPIFSPAPTGSCIIHVAIDGCLNIRLLHLIIRSNCQGSLVQLTFRYNGGDCSQSDNLQAPTEV